MMSSFSREYADIYDLLYNTKDYEGEIHLIEQLIGKYKPDTKKILDYGCGTGTHAKALALKGYEISGIDKNENTLGIAKQKLKDREKVSFYHTSERNAIAPGSIDVCITLFDVISYMNANDEIRDFLLYVKNVLKEKGMFIFDFWYGPGVINLRPEKRWKEYTDGDRRIMRLTDPLHDHDNCIVSVTHEVIISERDRITARMTEIHKMRYFFKNEILLFLSCCGFEVLDFGTWKDLSVQPAMSDWSALAVVRKV
ncbi:MAG: class I SAM-dependent methyltransferase [Thermodesulfovibrionales bacterium]